ncbi:EF-hand domain-containing protein [Brevundimonas goettingensis]|uniref:EF-hand domain-containing protein n=1 Tax=Brevundimonas goettingensis TaxID=2774190 RepID=A0A975C388_9CAUL|nr:EF-hand domain-containing protein [Brevundimonas goettingensis]QTC90516.1 hypothetical protein IFJ75_14720 [Brevundimonas goettingensis]
MTRQLSPKKSETLEIRLPHQTKTAFMARCQTEGRTASEAVRRFIDGEIAGPSRRPRVSLWQAFAAAAAGLAIGAVAAPSLAQTSHAATAPRAAFDRLDRNHDGVVSYAEFRAG